MQRRSISRVGLTGCSGRSATQPAAEPERVGLPQPLKISGPKLLIQTKVITIVLCSAPPHSIAFQPTPARMRLVPNSLIEFAWFSWGWCVGHAGNRERDWMCYRGGIWPFPLGADINLCRLGEMEVLGSAGQNKLLKESLSLFVCERYTASLLLTIIPLYWRNRGRQISHRMDRCYVEPGNGMFKGQSRL